MENKGQENKRDVCEKISLILFKDIKAFYKGNYTTITNLEKKNYQNRTRNNYDLKNPNNKKNKIFLKNRTSTNPKKKE